MNLKDGECSYTPRGPGTHKPWCETHKQIAASCLREVRAELEAVRAERDALLVAAKLALEYHPIHSTVEAALTEAIEAAERKERT